MFSGDANNGANAGFAYANVNNAPSNTNANIGSQLCLFLKVVLSFYDITHCWRPCPKSAVSAHNTKHYDYRRQKKN